MGHLNSTIRDVLNINIIKAEECIEHYKTYGTILPCQITIAQSQVEFDPIESAIVK